MCGTQYTKLLAINSGSGSGSKEELSRGTYDHPLFRLFLAHGKQKKQKDWLCWKQPTKKSLYYTGSILKISATSRYVRIMLVVLS